LLFAQEDKPQSQGSQIIARMQFEEIELNIPEVGREVTRVELANGLVIYLYEDHRLPLFNIRTLVRCGQIFDTPEKDGLSGLVGTVMRTGGTNTINGDSLNVLLEYIGGSLETGVGDESGSASLSILSKDIDLGLQLYADLLRNPAFPEEKLDLAKEEIKTNIKRRNDHPRSINSRYFYKILYDNHPYGRILEWATVKDISRDDLMKYHQRYYLPNNIIIGISGDFDTQGILKKIEEHLGDWEKSSDAVSVFPDVAYEFHPGVYQIKKDINQANIRMGHLGIKRDNPDRYAINLMNYILGGGSFTSRMTSKVRSDEGLAYSVGSSFNIGSRDYGTFNAYCQTKSSTAFKAIDLMVKEIERIQNDGVTPEELHDAREAVINRFIFNFDNAGEIVSRLMSLEFNDFPSDYYKRYLDYYRAVTIEDIKRVANEYLHPDQLSFVIVGNPDDFDQSLETFGQVTDIELTDPVLD
jgi:predicted Zn-dependent peptidase